MPAKRRAAAALLPLLLLGAAAAAAAEGVAPAQTLVGPTFDFVSPPPTSSFAGSVFDGVEVGVSMSISDDGLALLVGAKTQARLYERASADEPFPETPSRVFLPEFDFMTEAFGQSVALSGNGLLVVVADSGAEVFPSKTGLAVLYARASRAEAFPEAPQAELFGPSSADPTPHENLGGQPLAATKFTGRFLAVSADGRTVVALAGGAPHRVFTLDVVSELSAGSLDVAFDEAAPALDGSSAVDLAMSADGRVLVVARPSEGRGNGTEPGPFGHVEVYTRAGPGEPWVLDQALQEPCTDEVCGLACAISRDGKTVAFSSLAPPPANSSTPDDAPFQGHTGSVFIFELDDAAARGSRWKLAGVADGAFGLVAAVSNDGRCFMRTGLPDAPELRNGTLRVLQKDGNLCASANTSAELPASAVEFGAYSPFAIAVSGDESVIACSAYSAVETFDSSAPPTGALLVFKYEAGECPEEVESEAEKLPEEVESDGQTIATVVNVGGPVVITVTTVVATAPPPASGPTITAGPGSSGFSTLSQGLLAFAVNIQLFIVPLIHNDELQDLFDAFATQRFFQGSVSDPDDDSFFAFASNLAPKLFFFALVLAAARRLAGVRLDCGSSSLVLKGWHFTPLIALLLNPVIESLLVAGSKANVNVVYIIVVAALLFGVYALVRWLVLPRVADRRNRAFYWIMPLGRGGHAVTYRRPPCDELAPEAPKDDGGAGKGKEAAPGALPGEAQAGEPAPGGDGGGDDSDSGAGGGGDRGDGDGGDAAAAAADLEAAAEPTVGGLFVRPSLRNPEARGSVVQRLKDRCGCFSHAADDGAKKKKKKKRRDGNCCGGRCLVRARERGHRVTVLNAHQRRQRDVANLARKYGATEALAAGGASVVEAGERHRRLEVIWRGREQWDRTPLRFVLDHVVLYRSYLAGSGVRGSYVLPLRQALSLHFPFVTVAWHVLMLAVGVIADGASQLAGLMFLTVLYASVVVLVAPFRNPVMHRTLGFCALLFGQYAAEAAFLQDRSRTEAVYVIAILQVFMMPVDVFVSAYLREYTADDMEELALEGSAALPWAQMDRSVSHADAMDFDEFRLDEYDMAAAAALGKGRGGGGREGDGELSDAAAAAAVMGGAAAACTGGTAGAGGTRAKASERHVMQSVAELRLASAGRELAAADDLWARGPYTRTHKAHALKHYSRAARLLHKGAEWETVVPVGHGDFPTVVPALARIRAKVFARMGAILLLRAGVDVPGLDADGAGEDGSGAVEVRLDLDDDRAGKGDDGDDDDDDMDYSAFGGVENMGGVRAKRSRARTEAEEGRRFLHVAAEADPSHPIAGPFVAADLAERGEAIRARMLLDAAVVAAGSPAEREWALAVLRNEYGVQDEEVSRLAPPRNAPAQSLSANDYGSNLSEASRSSRLLVRSVYLDEAGGSSSRNSLPEGGGVALGGAHGDASSMSLPVLPEDAASPRRGADDSRSVGSSDSSAPDEANADAFEDVALDEKEEEEE